MGILGTPPFPVWRLYINSKMDQFYISYSLPTIPHGLSSQSLSSPLLPTSSYAALQLQATSITLSPLIRSYISSLLISLRLHPAVISTSISPRAVGDIRSLLKVMGLRQGSEGWINAEGVKGAFEACVVGFRMKLIEGCNSTKEQVWQEVLQSVKAPF